MLHMHDVYVQSRFDLAAVISEQPRRIGRTTGQIMGVKTLFIQTPCIFLLRRWWARLQIRLLWIPFLTLTGASQKRVP